MKEVKIAQLKSQLSKYLRQVQEGEEVIVMDRSTPIARMIPYKLRKEKLIIRPAKESLKEYFKTVKIPPASPGVDSLKALLEERADDLEEVYK